MQHFRFDRRRFQNHIIEGLLRPKGAKRGIGMLASLQEMSGVAATLIIKSVSPNVFSKRFIAEVGSAGPLTAVKGERLVAIRQLLTKGRHHVVGGDRRRILLRKVHGAQRAHRHLGRFNLVEKEGKDGS